jgi:hypothetical protein
VTEVRKFTKEEQASFGYTVAELRQLAREHQVRVPSRALHHELVAALKAAGVELPAKPLERASKIKPGTPVERISRKPPAAGLTGRKLERYLYQDCALLALAVAERTGWPAVQIFDRGDDGLNTSQSNSTAISRKSARKSHDRFPIGSHAGTGVAGADCDGSRTHGESAADGPAWFQTRARSRSSRRHPSSSRTLSPATRGLSSNRTASGVSGPVRAGLPPSSVPMRVAPRHQRRIPAGRQEGRAAPERSRLSHVFQNYFRPETIAAANVPPVPTRHVPQGVPSPGLTGWAHGQAAIKGRRCLVEDDSVMVKAGCP